MTRASWPTIACVLALASTDLGAQQQSPTFGRLRTAIRGPGEPLAGLLGDVDGDAILDLVYADGAATFYSPGDGLARFPASPVAIAPEPLTPLFLVDMDGDLDLDLVASRSLPAAKQGFALLLNDGLGTFTDASAAFLPFAFVSPWIDLGDVDGDGDPDVFLAHGGTYARTAVLLFNDGAGSFHFDTTRLPAGVDARSAYFFRADADADLDLIFRPDLSPYAVKVLLNDSLGTFAFAPVQPTFALGGLTSAPVIDLDGDGDDDLLASSAGGVLAFVNDGSGTFPSAGNILGTSADDVLLSGDLDGNGLPDLVFRDAVYPSFASVTDRTFVALNQGGFSFAIPQSPLYEGGLEPLHAGDLDRDGDADLVGEDKSPELFLWLNDGHGALAEASRAAPEGPNDGSAPRNAVAIGDLDGDAFPEVVAGSESEGFTLWHNDGTAQFTPEQVQPALGNRLDSPSLLDADGDGDLDVLASARMSPFVSLFVNQGGVLSEAQGALPPPTVFSNYLLNHVIADLDGDGDLDAAIADYTGRTLLLLNDGHGVFADASVQVPRGGSPTWLSLGDVDADGDADLLQNNGSKEPDRLLRNDGAAHFSEAPGFVLANEPAYPVSSALADVDGDGDLDLLVSADTGHQIYENDGAGRFSEAPGRWQIAPGTRGTRILPVDVDHDGDLDVVGGNDLLWLNRGDGFLADASQALAPTRTFNPVREAAVGDLDLDGDVDIWLSGTAQIQFQLERQLSWASFPRVGKALELELHGTREARWTLYASLRRARTPTDLGELRLAGPEHVRSGALDAQGSARTRFEVPADPALVGVTLYWQALVGDPPRLTNLERTTLSAF